MRNNHNPYFSSQTVIRAAAGLAKLVKEHGKPIAFDMDDYAQLVVGIHSGKHTEVDLSVLDNLESEQAKQSLRQQHHLQKINSVLKAQFVEAMHDALSLTDVYNIMPCLLVEVGVCTLDWTLGAGMASDLPDAARKVTAQEFKAMVSALDSVAQECNDAERNWYLVIPQPQSKDCFVLDL